MKTYILAFLTLFSLLSSSLWADGRMAAGAGGGGGFSGGGGGFSGNSSMDFRSSAVVSPRLRSLGVRTVPHYGARSQFFSSGNRSSMVMPASGPRGSNIRSSIVAPRAMSSAAVRNNMSMVNNGAFRSQMLSYNARENIVGHYYWHAYNGTNFCHYYDRWGCNWYGWYCGSGFYWSCWWGNNWWWYDPIYYRWCYWYDGWWWWQDPDNVTVTYVYTNGQYVPEESNAQSSDGQTSEQSLVNNDPTSPSMATAPEAKTIGLKTFRSKDGTRLVKIAGDYGDAFLYDTSASPKFKVKYLGSAVQKVTYTQGADGKMRITLLTQDGSSQVFDGDGNSVEDNS